MITLRRLAIAALAVVPLLLIALIAHLESATPKVAVAQAEPPPAAAAQRVRPAPPEPEPLPTPEEVAEFQRHGPK